VKCSVMQLNYALLPRVAVYLAWNLITMRLFLKRLH